MATPELTNEMIEDSVAISRHIVGLCNAILQRRYDGGYETCGQDVLEVMSRCAAIDVAATRLSLAVVV